MKLTEAGIQDQKPWEQQGCQMFHFNRAAMIQNTLKAPVWMHFGAGNIFRAFLADIVQEQLEQGLLSSGILAVEGFDYEIVEKVFWPHSNLSFLVTLKPDGTTERKVLGSIAETYCLRPAQTEEWNTLKEFMIADSLQILSFTITEKGYVLRDNSKELLPEIKTDLKAGPAFAASYMGKVVALLYERFLAKAKPIALVSMDNCSQNGDQLAMAVKEIAGGWEEQGLVRTGFFDYVCDPAKVAFPCTMIDKITPRPDKQVLQALEQDGFQEMKPVITQKQTYTAPYVNAEKCGYLVIEDWFPNGRPQLCFPGVWFTDRETVEQAEKMKVCTCLNPLHTALAVFGCLLGYTKISEEMQDPLLYAFVERLGYKEGLPVSKDPKILHPESFLTEVLKERLPNPYLPDTPQRIATDTSQKLSIRFGETLNAYQKKGQKGNRLVAIPLILAGWLRYLIGVDDQGKEFPLSPDPKLAQLQSLLSGVQIGKQVPVKQVEQILSEKSIFGLNLIEAGYSDQILMDFQEMLTGKGAVRNCLEKRLQENRNRE